MDEASFVAAYTLSGPSGCAPRGLRCNVVYEDGKPALRDSRTVIVIDASGTTYRVDLCRLRLNPSKQLDLEL